MQLNLGFKCCGVSRVYCAYLFPSNKLMNYMILTKKATRSQEKCKKKNKQENTTKELVEQRTKRKPHKSHFYRLISCVCTFPVEKC